MSSPPKTADHKPASPFFSVAFCVGKIIHRGERCTCHQPQMGSHPSHRWQPLVPGSSRSPPSSFVYLRFSVWTLQDTTTQPYHNKLLTLGARFDSYLAAIKQDNNNTKQTQVEEKRQTDKDENWTISYEACPLDDGQDDNGCGVYVAHAMQTFIEADSVPLDFGQQKVHVQDLRRTIRLILKAKVVTKREMLNPKP